MKKLKVFISSLLMFLLLLTSPSGVLALTLQSPTSPTSPDFNNTDTSINLQSPDKPVSPFGNSEEKSSNDGSDSKEGSRKRNKETSSTPKVTAENTGNGADSTNTTEVDVNDETAVEAVNNADVQNDIIVDVDTGENEANKNMGDGVINTGDASVDGTLVNDVNNTIIDLNDGCGGCTGGLSAENSGNGSGSTNTSDVNSNTSTDVNAVNNLYMVNNEQIGAETGDNDANKNMGDGVIVSGDADVVFTTVNLGNNTMINPTIVNFNIVDDQSEDLYITFPTGSGTGASGVLGATNFGNGSDSLNDANVSSTNNTNIDTTNNLVLDNNVDLFANTGNNEADKNMGEGVIETGDANIVSNIINFLNNSIVAGAEFLIGSVNIFGDMSGDIILPREADLNSCGCASDITAANTGNGSGSTNLSGTNVTDTTTINQTNNALINTNLNIDANTGGNSTEKNMGDSSITTGDVNVSSNLVNVANTNTVGNGDAWWLVIINNQGTYTGKIVGAADGATIDGSGLEFGFNPDGSIYALNSGNGADSTNTANTNVNNNTTINQTNNAVINNNININANTGGNSASGNMGGATINTGDVNVSSNIVNFINNNFVGKKFMLVFVNIFGSFTGNIVPPDQEIPGENQGGPTGNNNGSTNGLSNSVNLPKGTKLSTDSSNSGQSSYLASSNSGLSGSLNEALEEGGKLLEKAAASENPVKQIVNTGTQKGSFSYNFLLLGGALIIIAGYAFIMRRKAS